MEPSPTVLVIGAGPAGLATAACLKQVRVPFRLVDRRGIAGGAFRHIYSGVTLQSPARYTSLPGLPLQAAGEYVTVPEYRAYLDRYADHHRLFVENAAVESVERLRERFLVHFAGVAYPVPYQIVVVATGMYDSPMWPTIDGLTAGPLHPEILHARSWPGPDRFRGQRLLIVGGATGAVELGEECARAGLQPTLSARSGVQLTPQRFLGRDLHDYAYVVIEKIPVWLLDSFCGRRPTLPGIDHGFKEYRRAGQIRVRTEVRRFEAKEAVFADGSREEFDAVVLATGYRFDMPFLSRQVARAPAGHPLATHGESRSWPGLFFVGLPCERTLSSEFLRGIGQDAPVVARRIKARLAAARLRR